MIATRMKKGQYDGCLRIYCHDQLPDTITTICRLTIQDKFFRLIGDRILLIPVQDGETVQILNYPVTFFDIHSTKARQFGFTTVLENGKRFTCCGDEPFNPACESYVKNSCWLTHEAFCLFSQADTFKPYEKHHSTVKDACQLARSLEIENLILWHTEDKNIRRRQELYLEEGRPFFSDGFWCRKTRPFFLWTEPLTHSQVFHLVDPAVFFGLAIPHRLRAVQL